MIGFETTECRKKTVISDPSGTTTLMLTVGLNDLCDSEDEQFVGVASLGIPELSEMYCAPVFASTKEEAERLLVERIGIIYSKIVALRDKFVSDEEGEN